MMREFYNRAFLVLLGLLGISIVIGYMCESKSHTHLRLLPAEASQLEWHLEATSDKIRGGLSTIKILTKIPFYQHFQRF